MCTGFLSNTAVSSYINCTVPRNSVPRYDPLNKVFTIPIPYSFDFSIPKFFYFVQLSPPLYFTVTYTFNCRSYIIEGSLIPFSSRYLTFGLSILTILVKLHDLRRNETKHLPNYNTLNHSLISS